MTRTVLGIDAGATGALANWREGAGIETAPMPKTHIALRDLLSTLTSTAQGEIIAYLEDPTGNAGGTQTAQQGMSLGRNFGQIEMALLCLNISFHKVRPTVWQETFSLGAKKDYGKKWKHHIHGKVGEMFPALKCPLYAADSVLICTFGWRREFNTQELPR